MTRRYYANAAPQQTTSGSLTTGATSLGVAGSFTGWPTSFPFFACLELGTSNAEIVSVTAIAGTAATIVRAQDGTTAVTHPAGVTFDQVFVRQDADEANAHVNASSGVHGVAGAVVGTTDVQTLTNKTLTNPTITGGSSSGSTASDAVNTGDGTHPALVGRATTAGGKTLSLQNSSSVEKLSVDDAGNVTAVAVTASGAVTGASFTTAGAATVGGAVNANGAGTGLAVANNATVGGTLGVTGTATVGALTTAGAVAAASVAATGAVSGASEAITGASTAATYTATGAVKGASVLVGSNEVPSLSGIGGTISGAMTGTSIPLIQAGSAVISYVTGGVTLSFPNTFPNGLLTVLLTPGDITTPFYEVGIINSSTSTSGVKFKAAGNTGTEYPNSTNLRVNYIAIGW